MTTYHRDGAKVKAVLRESQGAVVTTAPCYIQVPERYLERQLASIGNETYVLGIFALLLEDGTYAVSRANAMVRINPVRTDTVVVDGQHYLLFAFDPGSVVIDTTDLVQSDTLTYYIYDEHIAKGRVPWYLDYFDLAKLFDTAKRHAGMNLGNRAVVELIISTTVRDPDDKTVLYRHVLTKASQLQSRPPVVVPFRSVVWNTTDTTSKLIGAYFGDSITSALVHPSERVERIESLLRQ